MANSKCPKCEKTRFELKDAIISGANFKMFFVQCASCGTVINTVDYFDTGALLKKQIEKIEHLEKLLHRR